MQSRWKRKQENLRRQKRILAHHKRVLSQKPLVDTTAPRCMHFQHMKVNKKKQQMLRERQQRIWKHNQDINESLVDIETRKVGEYTARAKKNTKSLHIKVRQDEIDRINRENQRILEGLTKSRARGNAGSHAKFGPEPMKGWKHHEESYEEFRRRMLELPQLKPPKTWDSPNRSRRSTRPASTGTSSRPRTSGEQFKSEPQNASTTE